MNTRTGKVNYKLHTILPKPEIELDSKYGHVFSQADKTNLKETLNMGRLGNDNRFIDGREIPGVLFLR